MEAHGQKCGGNWRTQNTSRHVGIMIKITQPIIEIDCDTKILGTLFRQILQDCPRLGRVGPGF